MYIGQCPFVAYLAWLRFDCLRIVATLLLGNMEVCAWDETA